MLRSAVRLNSTRALVLVGILRVLKNEENPAATGRKTPLLPQFDLLHCRQLLAPRYYYWFALLLCVGYSASFPATGTWRAFPHSTQLSIACQFANPIDVAASGRGMAAAMAVVPARGMHCSPGAHGLEMQR